MAKKRTARQKAILRRNLFFTVCLLALVVIIMLVVFGVKLLTRKPVDRATPVESAVTDISSENTLSSSGKDVSSKSTPSSQAQSSQPTAQSEQTPSSEQSTPAQTAVPDGLDPDFSKLLLVNGEKPLPENYDYEGNLTTIPDKYINGSLKQIDKDVWPYMRAMIEAAWKDGVQLYVWSPYRSYDTQNMLFQKQVNRQKERDPSLTQAEAEAKAATVVARPGTSEHNTGLAADFNMADDKFETTPMYEWMTKHAEEYGFILRYTGEKQAITGVIHESWHWRFVGINKAKEINRSGLCLEEYLAKQN